MEFFKEKTQLYTDRNAIINFLEINLSNFIPFIYMV